MSLAFGVAALLLPVAFRRFAPRLPGAAGVETLRSLALRLRQSGVTLVLSGVKRQVQDVLERPGAIDALGRQNFYGSDQVAIADLRARLARNAAAP
jgi:SulP family sulfate permease